MRSGAFFLLTTLGFLILWTQPAVPLFPVCRPPASDYLANFPYFAQLQSSWCWAATGQMVMQFLGKSVQQCQQAADQTGLACCGMPFPVGCDAGSWPLFEEYGFSYDMMAGKVLTEAQIKAQIHCSRKPIAHAYVYAQGVWDGHMVVAYGYSWDPVQHITFIEVYDPDWQQAPAIPYDEYARGPATNSAPWRDYYNITKK